MYIYRFNGATTLMTWYKIAGLTANEPAMGLVLRVCLLLCTIVVLIFNETLVRSKHLSNNELLKELLFESLVFVLLSQLIFSSVSRLTYETLFCLVLVAAVMIDKIWIRRHRNNSKNEILEEGREIWDLLKYVSTFGLGFSLPVVASGLIDAYYGYVNPGFSEEEIRRFMQLQLYRNLGLIVYFWLGIAMLIIYPIIRRFLEIKERLNQLAPTEIEPPNH